MTRRRMGLPISAVANALQRHNTMPSALIAAADARFTAEREHLVRTIGDVTVKERLAAQLDAQHDAHRKSLVEWSNEVDRRLNLLKARRPERTSR
jgi:hypothetical protein